MSVKYPASVNDALAGHLVSASGIRPRSVYSRCELVEERLDVSVKYPASRLRCISASLCVR